MKKYVNIMAWKQGKDLTQKEIDRRAQAIEDAIDAGIISYRKVAKAAKLTIPNLQLTFRKRPELHKKYRVALLTLQMHAESNLVDAIVDPSHPKNFEATKFFMGKYKVDMDTVFEKVADTPQEVEVSVTPTENGNGGNGSLIKINFTSQSKKKEEDE